MTATPLPLKQLWCKLAVLIADGPHTPHDIDTFAGTDKYPYAAPMVDVIVGSAAALWWWAEQLGATNVDDPAVMEHNGQWRQTARTPYDATWHGWIVTVKCFNASVLGQPVDPMATVRALAEAV